MALYIKQSNFTNLIELLEIFFIPRLDYCNSLNCLETYTDKDCIILQCPRNKYRSFDEILELAVTYFPETTKEQLISTLLKLNFKKENIIYKPYFSTCSTINKITFFYYDNYFDIFLDEDYNKKMINSNYTWKEILNSININNYTEFIDFINKNKFEKEIQK